ncbi:MAG: hypothetical protein VX768_05160 [Planctomycetota bacterium]|nr:hypothetical protein [Planctomycetota bacterium]
MMTTVDLDPIVGKKIGHFKRRRIQLLIARGVSVGLLSFLFSFAIVAFADWYWLLGDSVRWTLTLASYGFVALSVWLASVSRIARNPSDEETAVLMEHTEPELRENLLSAVELATDDPDSLHDSPVFRGLLQGKVARQMGSVQVNRLLPLRLVARWLLTAFVFVSVVAALLITGDSRLRQLAARALMPGANIARISRVQVEVISPSPSSLIMAEDETVAVVVEVTGGSFREVILETSTPTTGVVRQRMTGRSEIEFAANVHLADEPVEYRIFAGDAITQRFTIDTRSRPHVVAFRKTHHYPDYTELDPVTVNDNHGDLIVLEGTLTQLALQIDQPVSRAELRISQPGSDEVLSVPLSISTQPIPGQASGSAVTVEGEVPIEQPSFYKVHLVSEETGFENIFAPKFEIRPQPDLVPKAGFINQQETTLLLPPNDILSLQAMAEDDLPLVSLEQHVSVNGDEWLALEIGARAAEPGDGRKMEASWTWDFIQHQLKPGDEVVTKLVALDRKGNIGESIPLRIVISDFDFNPDRHTTMLKKLRFYEDLLSFATEMERLHVAAVEIVSQQADSNRGVPEKRADRVDLEDILSKQQEQSGELLQKSLEVLKSMPAGADAQDMDLAGRVLSRLHHGWVPQAFFRTAVLDIEDGIKSRSTKINDLKYTLERIADDSKSLAYHFQSLATHNLLAGIAGDLHAMTSQQQSIVETASDTFDRLKRQQAVVTGKLEKLSRLAEEQGQSLPQNIRTHLDQLIEWIGQELETISEATESEDRFPQLKSAAANLAKQLASRQRFNVIDGGLPGRMVGARRDFQNRSGSLFNPLYELAASTREDGYLRTKAAEKKNLEAQKQYRRRELSTALRPALEQLRARREITQARPDADSQYAADAGLTSRAALFLLSTHQREAFDPEADDHLFEIAPAYRTLEAGHALKRVELKINLLLNRERWNSQSQQALLDHPRQWDALYGELEIAVTKLKSAQLDQQLLARIDQLRWSPETNRAKEKITSRRWKQDQLVSAANELSILRSRIAELDGELQPWMEKAREVIRQYAPTIAEMAKQAAEEVRELEKQTKELANEPESVDDKSPDLEDLQQKQEQVNQQLDDLAEALVEEANNQDLLDDEERERARDADDSIQMIQEPAEKMNKALDKAEQAEAGQEQARQLTEAAEKQKQTAQALDKVAEHFEKLDAGEDISESREELRQIEQQTGIENELEENFREADQLAEMAQQNPLDLMKELEAELQRNPEMQKALSQIARNTLYEAENSLREAAQKENAVQQQNEASDTEFQKKKNELAQELRELGNEAAKLSRELVQRANQAAREGKTDEASEKLSEAQQELMKASQEASRAQPSRPLEDLQQLANESNRAIQKANQALQNASQETNKGKNEPIHADENARKAQQANAEKQRQQFREWQKQAARQETRAAEAQKRQADLKVRQAEQRLRQTEMRAKRHQDALNRKPDDQARKNLLKNEQERKKADQQNLEQAKSNQQKANAEVQKAKATENQVANKPKPPLNAANPSTQFADEVTREAKAKADQLQAKAEQLAKKSDFQDELKPSENQLANAEKQQQQITESVKETAEDLRRAARHEQRLNNQQAADELDEVARNVQKTADEETTEAEQQIAEAAREAEQSQQAESNPEEGKPKQDKSSPNKEGKKENEGAQKPNQEALEAQESISDAKKALENQADALTEKIESLQNSTPEPTSTPEQGEPEQGEPQQGEPKQGEPKQGEPQQGEPQQGEPQQGEPKQGQPQQGEPQQGQPQQGEPQQGQPQQGEPQQGQPQKGEPPTAEETARGQQLAQALDELDRLMAQQPQSPTGEPQQGQPQQGQPQQGQPQQGQPLNSFAQAALTQQQAMAAARASAQQQSQLAQTNQPPGQPELPSDSQSEPSLNGPQKEFVVRGVERDGKDWGKLRGKSAESGSASEKTKVSEEYRKKVEAYFKVLAERAKQKK